MLARLGIGGCHFAASPVGPQLGVITTTLARSNMPLVGTFRI